MALRAAYPPVLPHCTGASHLPEEWMATGPLHSLHQRNRGVFHWVERGGGGSSGNSMEYSVPLLCVLFMCGLMSIVHWVGESVQSLMYSALLRAQTPFSASIVFMHL